MTATDARLDSLRGSTEPLSFTARTIAALTAWCAISGGPCWPGGLAGVGLPFGGAVGDQAGDGQESLVEVFSSSEVALEGSPLLVLCVGVLDAYPFR